MRAKLHYLVILLAIVFTACAQPSNQSRQTVLNSPTAAPTTSPEIMEPGTPIFQPTQAWSKAPLSSGILLSRLDARTNKTEIYAIDPQNGLPIASAPPIPMGGTFFNVRSPDGGTLAAVAYPHVNNGNNGQLHFVDLSAWQDSSLEFVVEGWIGVLTYSPDGRYLAIITWQNGSEIYIVDAKAKMLVSQTTLKNKFAKAQFTRDGSGLMVYMNRWDTTKDTNIPPSAARLVVPSLEIQWEQPLDGIKHGFFATDPEKNPHEPGAGITLEPGVAFSPIENKVFILHADSERMTSVDYDRQEVTTVEIVPKMSWLERLMWLDAQPAKAKVLDGTFKKAVISQDGKTIYATGITNKSIEPDKKQWELQTIQNGLQVIEAQTGTELAHYDTNAEGLNLSPDGRWVFLYSYEETNNYGIPVTQVFDPQSGEMKITLDGQLYPAYSLNGELIYVSETTLDGNNQHLSIFDAQSFKKISNLASSRALYLSWLVGPLY